MPPTVRALPRPPRSPQRVTSSAITTRFLHSLHACMSMSHALDIATMRMQPCAAQQSGKPSTGRSHKPSACRPQGKGVEKIGEEKHSLQRGGLLLCSQLRLELLQPGQRRAHLPLQLFVALVLRRFLRSQRTIPRLGLAVLGTSLRNDFSALLYVHPRGTLKEGVSCSPPWPPPRRCPGPRPQLRAPAAPLA